MKEYKVFIASSNDEKKERNALKDLLQDANMITREYGIELVPIMWERESVSFALGLSGKQGEYNKKLISSDIVFFLFGKRVGKYTLEEFEVACAQLKENKETKVFALFKKMEVGNTGDININDVDNIGDIIKLKKHISEDLKQVYGEFESTDELQRRFMKEVLNLILSDLMMKPKNPNNLERLSELYHEINAPIYINSRDGIIENAINSLYFLNRYNLAPDYLTNKKFYDLLHVIISNTYEGAEINALSVMLESEWDDSEDERVFWKDNQDAVKRRVDLERIFIVNRNEAHRLKTIPQIKNHISLEYQYHNIHSYVVEKEILQQKEPFLLDQAGNGFIMINSANDKIVLLDEMPESQRRAQPILDIQRINEIAATFNRIKLYAIPLKEYLDNIAWSHYKKEMISIFVTTKCNLNCDYCFTNKNQNEHKGQTISLDFVKKGIDDYFAQKYMRHVRFFGAGEPTTEFELLKKIHKYAIDRGGPGVTFEIQTNGAFTDAVAIWLKNNINIIWISCDGTPEIQDMHRPFLSKFDKRKTSEVIEKNIRILLGDSSRAFVGIRATITIENILKQKEMIDYFCELGIKNIWVDPIFPSVGKTVLECENDFDTMMFAHEFLEATKYANSKKVFYGSILTCNFNDSVNKHCRACLPVPHLTTDGFVSACDMALFGKDKNHMSPLIYGEWDEKNRVINYHNDRIDVIRSRTTENMQHCEMCSAKEHCGGYCLGEVLNETGSLFGMKKGVCQAIRYLNDNIPTEMRKYKYTHP
jgi:radical SAM domain protein